MNLNAKLNIGLSGRFRPMVIDANTKRVVRDYGWNRNLITNSGLDLVATYSFADCMRSAVAGTDSTTPTTGQTALISQVLGDPGRSYTYVAGENGTVRTGGVVTHTRMYDFDSPTGSTIYREAGVSPSVSSYTGITPTPVFSRVLLNGSTGVTVSSTEQLRLVYELTVTYSPVTASNAKASLITHPGGDVDGYWAIAYLGSDYPFQTIGASGTVASPIDSNTFLEPKFGPSGSTNAIAWVSDTDKTLPGSSLWFQTYDSATHNFAKTVADANSVTGGATVYKEGYTNGTFTRNVSATMTPAQGEYTIKAFGFGYTASASNSSIAASTGIRCVCILDAPVVKSNTQNFKFTFTFTWNRV